MRGSVSKQGIINSLTNLYGDFNDYCKLPGLEETDNHVWGSEVCYGLNRNGRVFYNRRVQSVYVTVQIPLDIGFEEFENFLMETLPNLLKERTEQFFLETTGHEFSSAIAPQYILHYLNHWELMRDEDGQPAYETFNFGDMGYIRVTFVRYMAITPNMDYHGPDLATSPIASSTKKHPYTIYINMETCYFANSKEEAVLRFAQDLLKAVEQGRYKDYFTVVEEEV